MRIRTSDFPKFDSRNYATIRAHFDSVKPWQSKYNPDDERPIGQRACKLTSDGQSWSRGYKLTTIELAKEREGARFNKAMRMLADGSIAFRLYDTDCVVYHPNDDITIHGYASVSTNDFINALTPTGISQTCRGKGRDNYCDPVLHLRPIVECWYSSDYRYPDVRDRKTMAPDWSKGMVVNCDGEVRLHYSVEHNHYVPIEPERLEPFHVPTIDRRMAREVSREYNLPMLKKVLNAVVALTQPPAAIGSGTNFGAIMDALKDERYKHAIALMPRGQVRSFGRTHGTPKGIEPGFLRKLRDHIYNHEGVIERVDQHILTPAQYKRYVADSNRFD